MIYHLKDSVDFLLQLALLLLEIKHYFIMLVDDDAEFYELKKWPKQEGYYKKYYEGTLPEIIKKENEIRKYNHPLKDDTRYDDVQIALEHLNQELIYGPSDAKRYFESKFPRGIVQNSSKDYYHSIHQKVSIDGYSNEELKEKRTGFYNSSPKWLEKKPDYKIHKYAYRLNHGIPEATEYLFNVADKYNMEKRPWVNLIGSVMKAVVADRLPFPQPIKDTLLATVGFMQDVASGKKNSHYDSSINNLYKSLRSYTDDSWYPVTPETIYQIGNAIQSEKYHKGEALKNKDDYVRSLAYGIQQATNPFTADSYSGGYSKNSYYDLGGSITRPYRSSKKKSYKYRKPRYSRYSHAYPTRGNSSHNYQRRKYLRRKYYY